MYYTAVYTTLYYTAAIRPEGEQDGSDPASTKRNNKKYKLFCERLLNGPQCLYDEHYSSYSVRLTYQLKSKNPKRIRPR